MLYLNEKNIQEIGVNWGEIISTIEDSVKCLESNDYVQPIKPYLRYRDLKNRIIAMPAFIGGNVDMSGIKWIASFPDNIKKNIPRAHSVTVLNNTNTGKPISVINTALVSILRTAGVSGSILKAYMNSRTLKNVKVGIIGWGPIGRYHFRMITELLKDKIDTVFLYDINSIDKNSIDYDYKDKVNIASCWQEAYEDADIFITCTASKEPYIDRKPKKGALLLNVSLRDYKTDILEYVSNGLIVDDWEEVCRENTDIERMHIEKGLKKEDIKSIVDVICKNCMRDYTNEQVIMFNPMGMAIFDIAVGSYYYNKAKELKIGQELE